MVKNYTPSKFNEPIYLKQKSEAEIQADLYAAIKNSGLDPRLEVPGFAGSGHGAIKCKFDIVVFDQFKKPICIIECKRHAGLKNAFQQAKYEHFNLPLIYCYKHNHDEVMEMIHDYARF